MDITLELKNVFPIEYFRAIRFTIENPKQVIGHLIYLRQNYKNYNFKNGDELDEALLKSVRNFTVKADIFHCSSLLTKQEYDNALHITRGGS